MYIENVKNEQSDCINNIIMNKLKTRKSAKKRFRKTGTGQDRKSTRLNSSHSQQSRMPSSA